jgi:hypothetical protein
VTAPTTTELEALLKRITERIGRHLERRGLLVRDAESAWLEAAPGEDSVFEELLGHSITYRIAIGPQQGRKAFTLQALGPALTAPAGAPLLAKSAGFSLHAGVAAAAHQRDKVELLARYIARPAIAADRLSLTTQGCGQASKCDHTYAQSGAQSRPSKMPETTGELGGYPMYG